MNRSQLITGLVSIALLTIVASLAQGYLDGRLQDTTSLQSRSSRLDDLPKKFGDWERMSEEDLEPSVQRLLQCYGHANHVYRNVRTGTEVSMALLFGPRGPIAVHTPDICYVSRGTVAVGKREVSQIEGDSKDTFWRIQFRNGKEVEPSLESWYAWSDGGPWIASEHPRFWMTESLYKIQIAGPPGSSNGPSECKDFMQAITPVLRDCLSH